MNHFITKKRGKQIIAHFQNWFDQIQKINMCLLIRTIIIINGLLEQGFLI